MQLNHTCTLVTGASAGLGREITRLIVREQGGSVVAVARRRERLQALQQELQGAAGAEVIPLKADLSSPEQAARCFTEATADRRIDGVILNAGVTYYGKVTDQSAESVASLIMTNCLGPTLLATKFARYFVEQKIPGRLTLVSSLASFAPMPYQAVYAGTKAFISNYGLSLREELRGTGISVTVFCPGGIVTEMTELSGMSGQFGAGDLGMMDAVTCARHAVDAFISGRDLAVPGFANWVSSVAQRVAPRSVMSRVVERIYRGGLKQ
jgi:short-subunit dehydrogenase